MNYYCWFVLFVQFFSLSFLPFSAFFCVEFMAQIHSIYIRIVALRWSTFVLVCFSWLLNHVIHSSWEKNYCQLKQTRSNLYHLSFYYAVVYSFSYLLVCSRNLACCSAQTVHKLVLTDLAKLKTCPNSLLSWYIYTVA